MEPGEWFTGPEWLLDKKQWTSTVNTNLSRKKTSSHHFRQRLGIQGYCKLDKEKFNTEEWEATRPSCERRHQMAIQPFQIPMVGWNVWAGYQRPKEDSLQDVTQDNPKLRTAQDRDSQHRETAKEKIRLITVDDDDDWTRSSSISHLSLNTVSVKIKWHF